MGVRTQPRRKSERRPHRHGRRRRLGARRRHDARQPFRPAATRTRAGTSSNSTPRSPLSSKTREPSCVTLWRRRSPTSRRSTPRAAPIPPTAAAHQARSQSRAAKEAWLDVLVLGDSTILLDHSDHVTAVSDTRLASVAPELRREDQDRTRRGARVSRPRPRPPARPACRSRAPKQKPRWRVLDRRRRTAGRGPRTNRPSPDRTEFSQRKEARPDDRRRASGRVTDVAVRLE